MNYYERHLGDYARDTAHLSMIEHGAYGLLLDRYYATEKPIPADQVHRLARARSPEEVKAVDDVLKEFFTLVDGAWSHTRCDAEIAKKETKAKAAQANGRSGGRPKKHALGSENITQDKPTGFPLGFQNITQQEPTEKLTSNQSPVTSNQSPPYPQTGESDLENPAQPENQNPTETQHPTPQALATMAMRRAGLSAVNPGSPQLAALVRAGATPEVCADAAAEAVQRGKGFNYALSIVEGQLAKAAQIAQLGHVDMRPSVNPRLAGAI